MDSTGLSAMNSTNIPIVESHVDLPLWMMFFQIEFLGIFCSAVGIIIFASFRALSLNDFFQQNPEFEEMTLRGQSAIIIPITSSIFLVLFFYYFSILSFSTTIISVISSFIAIIVCLSPLIHTLTPHFEIRIPCSSGTVTGADLILVPVSLITVTLWLISGHWMLNNVLGLAACVSAIAFIRVPSIRVVTMLLVGLFFYDIFWVFYSSRIFGENVMVKVATTKASNPMSTIAKTLNLPHKWIIPQIHLPMKLIWGDMMLGLGDIVVPGILIAYALRFDYSKGNYSNGYFITAIIGYSIGFLTAVTMSAVYHHAQPALLYLVPSTLIPIILLGYHRGEFLELWNGTGMEKVAAKYDE